MNAIRKLICIWLIASLLGCAETKYINAPTAGQIPVGKKITAQIKLGEPETLTVAAKDIQEFTATSGEKRPLSEVSIDVCLADYYVPQPILEQIPIGKPITIYKTVGQRVTLTVAEKDAESVTATTGEKLVLSEIGVLVNGRPSIYQLNPSSVGFNAGQQLAIIKGMGDPIAFTLSGKIPRKISPDQEKIMFSIIGVNLSQAGIKYCGIDQYAAYPTMEEIPVGKEIQVYRGHNPEELTVASKDADSITSTTGEKIPLPQIQSISFDGHMGIMRSVGVGVVIAIAFPLFWTTCQMEPYPFWCHK